jgi:hypothetical protein
LHADEHDASGERLRKAELRDVPGLDPRGADEEQAAFGDLLDLTGLFRAASQRELRGYRAMGSLVAATNVSVGRKKGSVRFD